MDSNIQNNSNSTIETFNFNGHQLSVVKDENENIYFISKEVCACLDIENVTKAMYGLDEEEKLTLPLVRAGQTRTVNVVTESGLYSLVLRSNKPEAKPFKKWVTSEVLPSIRKHGAYMTENKLEEIIANPDLVISLATELKKERQEKARLQVVSEQQSKELQLQAPKVLFADSVSASDTNILIGDMAKVLKQNGVEIGERRFFDWLRQNSYLMVRSGSWNMPTQRAMELELFFIKERTINQPDGDIRITKTPMVTGKGQVYFVNKFLSKESA